MKLIIMLLFVVSCSSTVVRKIGKPSKYAPANHQELGVVKYWNRGADFLIEKRREDAYKQMYDSCSGDYQIIREGNQTQFEASFAAMDKDYWMIEFKCNPKTAQK